MENEGLKSIIYYRQWAELKRDMPDDIRLRVHDALDAYILGNDMPNESDPIYWMFRGWVQQIEKDKESYDRLVKRNRENGAKGGRPRKNPKNPLGFEDEEGEEDEENPKNPKKPLGPKKPFNDNYNDNDNEDLFISTNVDTSHLQKCDTAIFQEIKDFWNNNTTAMPKISGIKEGSTRRKLLNARLKEYGKEKVMECLKKACVSDFLNGGSKGSFVGNFDWVLKPNNFPKVLEGNYDKVAGRDGDMRVGTNLKEMGEIKGWGNNETEEEKKNREAREAAEREEDSQPKGIAALEEYKRANGGKTKII